ncbi:MAG TPA: efflux RND transporter permease subunit [Candidatus Binataceae bacterium]|nr:efflux RND transporter permease subunit [Candidatus Binataceae bacterium]
MRGNSTLAIALVIALSLLGVILGRSLPNAVFPQVQFKRAIILTDSGDLPSAQVLVAVTRPLEEAAYGVTGVERVDSTTTRGSSELDVTFTENSDPVASFELLNAAINEVRAKLPPGTTVQSRLLTSGTFPIIDISLSSPDRGLPDLTDVAQYDLVPSLHRIDGVYRVETVGAKYREYDVWLDPAKLLEHNLTPDDVVTGLANANVIDSAGRVMDKHRTLLTVVTADLQDADELAAVPIANAGGQPVTVRDIGDVKLGITEDYIRTTSENGPSVLVTVSQQPSGNTIAIADQTRAILRDFNARYPDVRTSFSYDQAALVSESFKSVRDAIVLGLVLAVAVVLIFTRSILSAAVAAIVVPCTIVITCVIMKAMDASFNMMTLGGLAAGIGLFIDDAIVMIEAVHRSRESGAPVADAVRELARPLIASTATVVIVFAPLAFLSGVTGVFFRALALTLGGGLIVSLLLALYFNPTLEQIVERWRRPPRQEGRIAGYLQSGYRMLLHPFMQWPALGLITAAAAIGGAFALYRITGTDYLPAMDEGAFTLDYITPPESTLADTDALLATIEHILKTTPEVAAFSRRTGTQLGFFLTESNQGDISVRLKSKRSRSISQVIDSVRSRILSQVPGVRVEFSQVLQDLIGDLSGTPEPVAVYVFGEDRDAITRVAREIARRINGIPGIVDVNNGIVLSNPEVQILIDAQAAERYGLSTATIQDNLHTVIEGTVATQLRINDRLYPLRVRYPEIYHNDLDLLPHVSLKTPGNGRVMLSSVATLKPLGLSAELDRRRLRPVITVTARADKISLGRAVALTKQRLADLELRPGVTLEYGGLYAEQQTAFYQLTLVLVAGIVGMFLVLVWAFGRFGPVFAVLIGALACLAGSFLALDLTGVTLNISSFMGVIMVAGITAKNGILLLDHTEHGVLAGVDPRVALLEAARRRMRPILMTTIATAAGLLPLALGIGAGAKVQQPLALAVIGGLVFALLFSTPLAGGLYLTGTRRRHVGAKRQ